MIAPSEDTQTNPKLTAHQWIHLVGDHNVSELDELFSVSRATVYQVLERHRVTESDDA